MEHCAQVGQFAAEHLADGLMAQTHPEYRFASGIVSDDLEQQSGLRGDARSGTEDNLVECVECFQFKLVVAHYAHLCAQFLHQVAEVIGKRVVIVYDNDFHDDACWMVLVGC